LLGDFFKQADQRAFTNYSGVGYNERMLQRKNATTNSFHKKI